MRHASIYNAVLLLVCCHVSTAAPTTLSRQIAAPAVCPIVLPDSENISTAPAVTVPVVDTTLSATMREYTGVNKSKAMALAHTARAEGAQLRIVGGNVPPPASAAHMVSFQSNFICSGSLLSAQWALTAAHCQIAADGLWFGTVGGTDRASGVRMEIEAVFNHPEWEDTGVMENDIALVKFKKAAPAASKFVLINAEPSTPEGGAYARAFGYGINEAGESNLLLQVDVPVKSSARCAAQITDTTNNPLVGLGIKDGLQICAGYTDGDCDSCQGDSGGPLVVLDQNKKLVQIGITSWGFGCGEEKSPGIYTRVSAFTDWMAAQGAEFKTSVNGQNVVVENGDESLLDKLCFPASATVELENGTTKTMQDLSIGDRVLVAAGHFSEVFLFTHRESRTTHTFLDLHHTASATPLTLTHGHYLPLNSELRAASTAVAGDMVTLGDGRTASITNITSRAARGLYNPQTLEGHIVVNGVRASTYTAAVTPRAAHAILTPLRLFFRLSGLDVTIGGMEQTNLVFTRRITKPWRHV